MNGSRCDVPKTESLEKALRILTEARKHYLKKHFSEARKLVRQYRQLIPYALIERQDRRIAGSPGVSVIVVSHKAGHGLLQCLNSLKQQTVSNFEIIVVDNGGNNEIHDTLERHPILHLRPPINLLPSEGRNLGAYFAQGDLLVFLDDDAIAAPGYVESIMLAWQIFDFSALRGRILPKSSLANQAVSGHYDLGPYPVPAALMTEGNMAIKKEVFLSVGGFDPLVFGGEGTELSHRCIKVMPGKDIYYWPGMLIFHDFARGKNFAAKKQRHAIASEYFNYLAPEINRLQAQYGRWYQMHPNKSVKYDNRGFAKKARAWIIETWTLLLNKFK